MRSDYAMAFHYLHTPPVATGVIRQSITDFVVEEQSLAPPSGGGEHLYIWLEKRGANSQWVAEKIATFCGVRDLDVGYAGRKDRHAVTRQWFSCYLPGKKGPDFSHMDLEGVSVLRVCRHTRKLRRGDLAANHFEVCIRDIEPSALLGEVADAAENIGKSGFPNYYGEQRFGRDQQNLVRANDFLKGDRRRQSGMGMLISAARSYMFNCYLSDCILAGEEVPATGPLYGMSRDPQPGECALDADQVAWVAGLRSRRVKAGQRDMIVRPEAFTWEFRERDVRLSFDLPPGCYATSLIRELVNHVDGGQALGR